MKVSDEVLLFLDIGLNMMSWVGQGINGEEPDARVGGHLGYARFRM